MSGVNRPIKGGAKKYGGSDVLARALGNKRLWSVLLIISLLSGVFGALYASIFYAGPERLYLMRGFRTGFSIAFLTAGFELFFVRSLRHSWLRKLPFLAALAARILIITALIRISLIGNEVLTNMVRGGSLTFAEDFANQMRDTLVSFVIVVIIVVFGQFSSLLGFHRFINLLMGRYFKPVREERAFLFIDLKNSTGLAFELGDVRFHEYLSQFFYEADQAIVRSGGEIVSYVGDAVIVTWPISKDREQNARAIVALGEIVARLEEVSGDFLEEFNWKPEIRAALHGGHVVVGECGDSRRQVTFLGEVVNMAARIEGEAKVQDRDFLASSTILATLELPDGVEKTSIGEVTLKGARAPIELFQLTFS